MARPPMQPAVSPQQISEDLWGAWKAQTLVTAIELDVFTHVAAGHRTAEQIARAARASRRGMRRLLDALVGLSYLTRKGRRYALTPVSRTYLVRGSELYLGMSAQTTRLHAETWSQLTRVVRTGRPVRNVDSVERAQEFFPKLVAAIFPRSLLGARAAVRSLPAVVRKRIRNILDVAAGSGAWSIAFARAIPAAQVTVIDLPEVTPTTRRFTRRFGVADRYHYQEGNLRRVDFGRERYDLVILGHIIHSEGERWGRKLVRKSYRALRPGGLLLIAEMIPNDTRTGPARPLLFGLNMLLHTEQGDVFTLREYRQWLRSAGFRKVRTLAVPASSPLILATK
jgi:ubiquinone/menaquinone biosynthesis C-methylase UbiE